jgi:hypothetical protein
VGRRRTIRSSFVQRSDSLSPYPSQNVAPQQDIHSVPLALPYPEWRCNLVCRARSQGMRELGRLLELALYNSETQAEKLAQERKKPKSQNEAGTRIYRSPAYKTSQRVDGKTTVLGGVLLRMDDSRTWKLLEWGRRKYSPSSPNMPFTDLFAFSPSRSPSRPDSTEPISSSPVLNRRTAASVRFICYSCF